MRSVILFVAIVGMLFGRENPFVPVISPAQSGKVAQVPELNPFSEAKINLPSSARKIKGVKILYQNIDGSLQTAEIALDNDIDWHYPIIISQKVEIKEPKSIQTISTEPKKEVAAKIEQIAKIDANKSALKATESYNDSLRALSKNIIEGFEFVSFEIEQKSLIVRTNDEKIRDFAVTEPTKVVIDLKRAATFKSKVIETKLPYFSEIAIGNHKDFYRLAIRLDGIYKYRLEKIDGGYKVVLE